MVATERMAVIPENEDFWRQYLGPYLSNEEVQRRLGVDSVRQVEELVEQRELLAVPTLEGLAYPAFQFRDAGTLDPTVSRVIRILSKVVVTPYTIASWLKGSKPDLLNGKTPLEWLADEGEPERVIEAAEHAAARLAR